MVSIIKSVPDIIRAWKAIFKKKEISNAGERERKKEEKKSSENKWGLLMADFFGRLLDGESDQERDLKEKRRKALKRAKSSPISEESFKELRKTLNKAFGKPQK